MKSHNMIRFFHDMIPVILFRDFIFKSWLRKQTLNEKVRATILLVNVTEKFCNSRFAKKVRFVTFTKIFSFLVDEMQLETDVAKKAALAKVEDMSFEEMVEYIQEG